MRKKLLVGLVSVAIILTGCSAGDPIVDNVYTNASYIRVGSDGSGGYWHEYNIDAFSTSPGGSGATLIPTNASTLGGYQLNGINEYIYFTTHVDENWDGVSDAIMEIYFEVNNDNSGGLVTDSVAISIECYHKVLGERVNTIRSHGESTVVGQAEQYDLFQMDIVMGDLRPGEVIAYRINLNTILSEVDDIIINYIEFKYPAYVAALER